ncbi:pimeloyl-ACP methyl ester esterase BioH [Laribacter hongkongensis]|uniref:pimeloyl-ACP methyl ester esterase BioH n=1 Tax=Laribacter hongkongensis TaxID=168471 RepID=UPI001EFCBAEA|nr:pimeloyl-ACP methyl ester esterase BioH [Laribacter hongkongensis]MCG9055540.1 pimeloyl-ACP methyl ester esterase BioH [Laribacter hongkongensis]
MLHIETLGQGPDVVFLHGWSLHGGIWQRVATALADRFTCHLVDLPGHGASRTPAVADLAHVADSVADAFPLPVAVVGWSLGGLVAMQWALQRPEAVRALALTATSPCFVCQPDWPHAQPAGQIAAVADSLGSDFEATLNRFLALQLLGAPDARTTVNAVRDSLFAHGRPQGLAPMLDVLVAADLRARVSQIACPVWLGFGARDAITPLAAGEWLATALPDALWQPFERASHAPFLSHESEFTARLGDFLAARL